MSLQFDEHRQYLADGHRMAAFERAITAVVRPGDVVADLGCGTGILGLLACRAGARRVYAVDDGGMIGVARDLAAANGYADRIVHIFGMSTRVTLPEPVDVVVADQIGQLGFEAGVVEFFADASRRWLRPGGQLLPRASTTWIAPVEDAAMAAVVDFWTSTPAGFDVSPVSTGALNTGYPTVFDASQLLAAGQGMLTYTFGPEPDAAQHARTTFTLTRAGRMDGLAGWFVAELADGVTMTNAPGASDRIGRRNGFLPLGTSVDVVPGDVVEVTLRVRPADIILAWQIRVTRGAEVLATAQRSTLAGMLLPRELLGRTDPRTTPRLSVWAAARATVIQLCDGVRPLADIEADTAARHPDLFRTQAEAAVFVAEVVTRYGHGTS